MTVALAQPVSARGSSKPLISGSPTFANDTVSFMDDFDAIYIGAIEQALKIARADLLSHASRLAGWKDIAGSLSVEYYDGGFQYTVLPTAFAEAQRLEYGDADSAPTGFLRKTAIRQSYILGKHLGFALSNEVPNG